MGISIEQYIVFAPNSGPIKIKPIISSPTFIINVMVETESGMKLLSTIAKAAPLPTETWLGSIKKNTAAATIAVPTVMIANSFNVFRIVRRQVCPSSIHQTGIQNCFL